MWKKMYSLSLFVAYLTQNLFEVLTLISDAAEYRLRELLGELAVLAEHRVDPLRFSIHPVDVL